MNDNHRRIASSKQLQFLRGGVCLSILGLVSSFSSVASACPEASLVESSPYVPHVLLLEVTHQHHPRLYDIKVKEVLRGPQIPQPVPHRLYLGEMSNLKDLPIGSVWVIQVLKRTYDAELFFPDCFHSSQVVDGMVDIGKDKVLPSSMTLDQLREELKKSNSIRGWW